MDVSGGRSREGEGAWEIPEVTFEEWRALGAGRSASRRVDERFEGAAGELVAQLLADPGVGATVEARGRRCRIVGQASRGGLRIDGGEGGFGERTVSVVDIAWVLAARAEAAEQGTAMVDEALVNRLRYLAGTPKASTRWIDTGWALALSEAAQA